MNAKTWGLLWIGSVCLAISTMTIFRLLIAGSIPMTWGSAIIMDGSYRVLNGQIPHVDLSSPIGPFIFIVGAIGMFISTPSVMGLNLGITLGGLGIEPLKGGLLYWHKGFTFNKPFINKYEYFRDQLNSNVKLIFLSKRFGHGWAVDDFNEAYNDKIFSSYKTVFTKDGDSILIRSDL